MRGRPWLDIFGFVAIVVADAFGLVPLTQTVLLLPLVWVSLHGRGEPWSAIGFSWPERIEWSIGVGAAAGVALELLAVFVTTPWISGVSGVEPDYSGFKEIHGNLTLLLIFLALSWSLAAFGEELCFRGFLMKRVAQAFGGSRAAWLASLLLSAALFGWGHTEQGVSGWIQEGLSGFLLGALFLLANRNLVVPIVAHGVSNTVAFVLIYLGRYPGLV